MAVSSDGARVAAVAGTSIVVVEVARGALRELPASRIATALYFVNGDRELAFSGGHFWSAGTGYSRTDIVNLATGSVETLVQHDDIFGTEQLEASADGTTLLTFGHGELAVWDVATRRKRVLPQPAWQDGTFKVYGLSADGREIATSLSDSQTVWFQRRRTDDDSVVEEIRIEGASTRPYAWSSRERLLIVEAAGDDGTVALAAADLASPKVVARACSPPPSRAVAFSADGTRLRANLSSGAEDASAVYDVATGGSVGESLSGPKWSVDGGLQSGWLWSPDWRWSAWTSEPVENGMVTKQVHLMRVEGGDKRTVLEWPSPNYGVEIAFSPDSRSLAVVDGPDHLLTVLDTETGAPISRQSLAGVNPWLIGFTPDGTSVLVETDDRIVRTVRWMDGASTAELMVGDDYVSASANGTLVVFGEGDAITYRDSAQLAKMPGIADFCFGFTPGATLSDDGSTVSLGEDCSRPYQLSRAPHVDIRSAVTGELFQRSPSTVRSCCRPTGRCSPIAPACSGAADTSRQSSAPSTRAIDDHAEQKAANAAGGLDMAMRVHEVHAAAAHAPLVILPAAALVDLAASLSDDRRQARLGRRLWWLGVGAATATGVAGLAASQEIKAEDERIADMMWLHGAANFGILLGATAIALVRTFRRPASPPPRSASGPAASRRTPPIWVARWFMGTALGSGRCPGMPRPGFGTALPSCPPRRRGRSCAMRSRASPGSCVGPRALSPGASRSAGGAYGIDCVDRPDAGLSGQQSLETNP